MNGMKSLIAPLIIALGAAWACSAAQTSDATAAGQHPAAPADVVELSAADARMRLGSGALTSHALTQAYLDRIAAVDDAGPQLNAVVEINPAALAQADALDAERKAGKVRGPLHGLPVLIKDNIDVAGMVNSAGSLAMADHRPKQDAFIARRLREAGVVILGKTNLSEWANFRSTRSSSGWSSRGGQTKNPYVLDRNPCGSSSGTGAAIAASLAIVGVGTETDGSIICPAAVNGLVGLKPTVGLVSRTGIIPVAISQDTAGPMGRTVADVALLLTALAAVDRADPAGPAAEGRIGDYIAALKPDALKGKRFGILRQSMGFHPGVDASMQGAITALTAAGAEVVEATIANDGRWNAPEMEVLLYEFKDGVNHYLKNSGAPLESLEALIAWNIANKDKAMPFFGQELFEQSQAKGPLTDPAYLKARDAARRLAGKDGLLATLDKQQLDAVIAPSVGPAWPIDLVWGDHFSGGGYGAAAVAGTPSLTVPVGNAQGLPLGLTFMSRPYTEADLLAWGHAFEQATKVRRPPEYKPTLATP